MVVKRLSEHKNRQKVEGLTEKLSALQEQEDRLEAEAAEWADKRDKLNERVRSLRDEVESLRSRRDEINDRVKELKQRRNEVTARIHERFEKAKGLQEERKSSAKRKPSRSHESLKDEVDSIDWTIQTTSLTLQEDKELVGKVKQLETQLAVYKKLEQVTRAITQARAEIGTMKSESEQLHKQLTENAQKSQGAHKEMLAKIEVSKTLKTEADKMHKKFLQARDSLRVLRQESKTLASQLSQLKGELREKERREQKDSEDALRETLERNAREKMKRGEKLSWEEFQLLAEKGITSQD